MTEDDNGAWKITSLLCSRGRGKRYENAFLHVKGMTLDDKKFSIICLMEPNIGKIHLFPKQLTAHGPAGLMTLNAPKHVDMVMMMVLNRKVEEKLG